MTQQKTVYDDGGPAFPVLDYIKPDVVASPPGKEGMSTRMWLAGMAMQGFIERIPIWKTDGRSRPELDHEKYQLALVISETSFVVADAMIAASRKDTIHAQE